MNRLAGSVAVAALVVGLVASGVVQADEVEGSSGVEAVAFAAAPAPVTFSVGFQRNSVTLSAAGKAKISDFLDNLPAGSTVESVQVTGRADTRCRDLPRVRGDVCAWRAVAGQRARSVVKYMRSLDVTAPIIRQVRGVNGRGADARRATVVITLTQAPPPTVDVALTNGSGIVGIGGPVFAPARAEVSFTYPCLDRFTVVTCMSDVDPPDPAVGFATVIGQVVFTNGLAQVSVIVRAAPVSEAPGFWFGYTTGSPNCSPMTSDQSSSMTTFTCTVSSSAPSLGLYVQADG